MTCIHNRSPCTVVYNLLGWSHSLQYGTFIRINSAPYRIYHCTGTDINHWDSVFSLRSVTEVFFLFIVIELMWQQWHMLKSIVESWLLKRLEWKSKNKLAHIVLQLNSIQEKIKIVWSIWWTNPMTIPTSGLAKGLHHIVYLSVG